MDDQTLIKAFLKKQKEIQDDFLARLNHYKAPIDTTELKRLVEDYNAAVYGAASIKPTLDTSGIDQTIKQAVASAISTVSLSSLTEEVKTQTRAIERNNSLLSNGTGRKLQFWIILFTLAFGVMVGWGVNWYFEIPAKIAGSYKKEQLLNTYRQGLLEGDYFVTFINLSCKLKKDYAKYTNQSIGCEQHWGSPKRLIQDQPN